MTAQPECRSGKVGHPSRTAAHRAAIAVGNKRTHARPRSYQCPDCHAWHLTSAPRVRQPRRRGDPKPPAVATREELDAWFALHSKPSPS